MPIKCHVRQVSILVKDKVEFKKKQKNIKNALKRKWMRQGGVRKRKAVKRSKKVPPGPGVYRQWPVLMPHEMLKSIHAAGLIQELSPGVNISAFSEWFSHT